MVAVRMIGHLCLSAVGGRVEERVGCGGWVEWGDGNVGRRTLISFILYAEISKY